MDFSVDKLYGKLKHEAVKLKREAKRVAEMETPIEKNLRTATSNENWGCPNSVLYELAESCQEFHSRQKIMAKVWEGLQGNAEKWRRLIKTLTLLEFLMKNGPESIIGELQSEQRTVKRLLNYQCSEDGHDRGGGVREKAKFIMELIGDRKLLQEEREKAQVHKSKFRGSSGGSTEGIAGGGSSSTNSRPDPGANGASMASEVRKEIKEAFGGINKGDFEDRFNKVKQQKEAEKKANESRADARSRDEGSDRRSREDRDDREPQRGSTRNRDRDDDEDRNDRGRGASAADYGLFDPEPRGPAQGDDALDGDFNPGGFTPKDVSASKKAGSKAAQADLLDMLDGPSPATSPVAAAPGGGGDWGFFDSGPASSPQPQPLAAPQGGFGGIDMFGDPSPTAAPAAPAAPADMFDPSGGSSMPPADMFNPSGGSYMFGGAASAGPGWNQAPAMTGAVGFPAGADAGGFGFQTAPPPVPAAGFPASGFPAPQPTQPMVFQGGMSSSPSGFPQPMAPVAAAAPAFNFAPPPMSASGPPIAMPAPAAPAAPAVPTSQPLDLTLGLDDMSAQLNLNITSSKPPPSQPPAEQQPQSAKPATVDIGNPFAMVF